MLLKLDEVNFRWPVLLDRAPAKNLWNPRACVTTDLYLDLGGRIPKLLLTPKGGDKVIRVIPYEALRDYTFEGGMYLPVQEEE